MEDKVSTQIWLIATIFGGIGAALVQIIWGWVQSYLGKKRARKHLRREISFNIKQAQQIIGDLKELKEEYIKLDRQDSYWHFFVLKHSSVVFRAMINAGIIYDFLDDEQLIKFDNFISENTDYMNNEVDKIRRLEYNKNESANKVDYFIGRYKSFHDDLDNMLKRI